MKKELAKIFLNIAYLFIGGVLLTGIMRQDVTVVALMLIGGIVPLLLIFIAVLLLWWEERNNKKLTNKNI